MMSREAVKAWVGPDWVRTYQIWRDWSVFHGKLPYRLGRRSTVNWRGWPKLPGGRRWRSDLTMGLHISCSRGAMAYRYRDLKMIKNPFDLCLYLQLLQELKPATIIEVGVKEGGTAAWLGDMLNNFGIPGRVWGIDINVPEPKYQPFNVKFLRGDESFLERVDLAWHTLPHPWLFINDASHFYAPTLASLEFANKFMVKGDYIIVEDGWLTEFGEDGRHRQGAPARAIAEFLHRNREWRIDAGNCDFYGHNVTANPNGYLVKL